MDNKHHSYNYKGGKSRFPKCVKCGKQLTGYKYKQCRECYLKDKETQINNGKMSKGRKYLNRKSHPLTQTHKDNISKANKGHKPSPQTIAASVKAHKNIPMKEETKAKLRQYKGDKTSNYKDGRTLVRGYHTFMAHRRRIRKLDNGGSHTLAEGENLKAQYNGTCPCCHKSEPFLDQITHYLTEDHIIPISKGGSDNIENIQPLCRSCNVKKYTKIIKY